jgi:hypothetical protein
MIKRNTRQILSSMVYAQSMRPFSAKQNKSSQDYKPFLALGLLAGTSAFLYNMKTAEADSDDKGSEKTFFQKMDIKSLAKEEFKIPQLLMEREQQKRKEYDERSAIDAKELGMDSEELA